MPARARSTWSGHKNGPWHPAAHELVVLVVVELEYYRKQFFIRVRPTSLSQNIYHDWTVSMVWGGAKPLKGWYVDDDDKLVRINKRAQAFRRRVQRFARSHGFGREFGGSSYAEDLYYAAVATLVDDGVVTKWVRRRDVRGGRKAQAAEWGFASESDMYLGGEAGGRLSWDVLWGNRRALGPPCGDAAGGAEARPFCWT